MNQFHIIKSFHASLREYVTHVYVLSEEKEEIENVMCGEYTTVEKECEAASVR